MYFYVFKTNLGKYIFSFYRFFEEYGHESIVILTRFLWKTRRVEGFRHFQTKLALLYIHIFAFLTFLLIYNSISLQFIDFSNNMVIRVAWFWNDFCEKIGGWRVISSFHQIHNIYSYLYFWLLQENFTSLYSLILLIFSKNMAMRAGWFWKLFNKTPTWLDFKTYRKIVLWYFFIRILFWAY